MADTTLTLADDELVTFSLSETDDAGNPVTDTPAGSTWTESSGGTVLTLAASADGSTCTATAVGALGESTLTYAGTTATGAPITGSCVITIVASAPTGVELVPGAPSHK